MEITQKPLPSNIDAERKILGCLILNNSLLPNIDNIIQGQDFYDVNHRILYNVIMSLIDWKTGTTSITIIEALKKKGNDRKVGGIEYIDRLSKNISDTDKSSIVYYAKLIAEKSEQRKLIRQGYKIIIDAQTGTKPASEILKVLQEDILLLSNKTTKTTWSIKDSLTKVYDYLEAFSKEHKGTISTGWEKIDNVLKGIKRKRIYIVGGLPSMGKTSFLIALAQNIVLQQLKVLYFTLEMSQDEILLRILSGVARVPNFRIEAPKDMLTAEWGRLAGAISEVSEWPLVVCDGSYTIGQFETEIKDHNPDVVIIDHIDCMPFHGEKSDTPFFLANTVVSLKKIAKDYNCGVIFASQLKESAERKTIFDYDISDYAGSRGKGRGVDIGMFVAWPDKTKRLFQWRIDKNRFGRIGYGRLHFIDMYGTFDNWED